MNKSVKSISTFLGVSMFMFGVLKFINPFKEWYSIQVENSELPFQVVSYWSGQLGEIVVGILLLLLVFKPGILGFDNLSKLFYTANVLIIIMMIVAFYVHLHPNVPAEVLPLKVSPPVIPGVFLLFAVANIFLRKKGQKDD